MSIESALRWLRTKGQQFADAGPRILDGMHRAAVYTGSLPDGTKERTDARSMVERWGALLRAHQTALNRWDAIADRVPGLDGLGALPVISAALAATIIAVVVSMAVVLRKLTAEERALRLLERGRITPAEAIELAAELEGQAPRASLFGGVPLWIPAVAGLAWLTYARGR